MEESTKVPADADAGSRPPLGTLPVLVYDHGLDPNNRQTAFAIGDHRLHTGVVPELADYYCVTPHGWVLLLAPGPPPRATRLWQPRTGESVSLPAMERDELPQYGDDWKCYLSDAPTAASCFVLVLNICKPSFLYCRVGGDDDDDIGGWKSHDYNIGKLTRAPPDHELPGPSLVIHEAPSVGGKFYFQGQASNKLGVIDLSSQATPELSYVDYPEPEFPEGCNCRRCYLVASRGELFGVYVCHKEFTADVLTVRVYKIHLSGAGAATPREVKDLGDRAFLLSYPNSQLLAPASKYGVKGNRVYFNHNVLGEMDGGMLCIYDLDEQSLEAVRPCPEITELLRKPFWVLPTHQDI